MPVDPDFERISPTNPRQSAPVAEPIPFAGTRLRLSAGSLSRTSPARPHTILFTHRRRVPAFCNECLPVARTPGPGSVLASLRWRAGENAGRDNTRHGSRAPVTQVLLWPA